MITSTKETGRGANCGPLWSTPSTNCSRLHRHHRVAQSLCIGAEPHKICERIARDRQPHPARRRYPWPRRKKLRGWSSKRGDHPDICAGVHATSTAPKIADDGTAPAYTARFSAGNRALQLKFGFIQLLPVSSIAAASEGRNPFAMALRDRWRLRASASKFRRSIVRRPLGTGHFRNPLAPRERCRPATPAALRNQKRISPRWIINSRSPSSGTKLAAPRSQT
jgi:hypothetical protein